MNKEKGREIDGGSGVSMREGKQNRERRKKYERTGEKQKEGMERRARRENEGNGVRKRCQKRCQEVLEGLYFVYSSFAHFLSTSALAFL